MTGTKDIPRLQARRLGAAQHQEHAYNQDHEEAGEPARWSFQGSKEGWDIRIPTGDTQHLEEGRHSPHIQ